MGTLKIDYDKWNGEEDILLFHPGNILGYTVINNGLVIGDTPTIRERNKDQLLKQSEDGIIGLITGGIEWLRSRGYSAAEVENKIKAYKQCNLDQSDQQFYSNKSLRVTIDQLSDPDKLLNKSNVKTLVMQ